MAGGLLSPINFVTGTLGCGKSYYAMRYVMQYLADGKIVCCNFDLVGDFWNTARRMSKYGRKLEGNAAYEWGSECRRRALRFDEQDDLYAYTLPGEGEDRGLLVMDEGALQQNARLWQAAQKKDKERHNNPIKKLEFGINMRKKGWTAIVIAHDQSMLDNQLQSLGGSVVRIVNFARVKMPLVGVSVTKNPRFLAKHYTPEVRGATKRELYGLKKDIAQHYRSMQEFEFEPLSVGMPRYQYDPGPLGWAPPFIPGRTPRPRGGHGRAAGTTVAPARSRRTERYEG